MSCFTISGQGSTEVGQNEGTKTLRDTCAKNACPVHGSMQACVCKILQMYSFHYKIRRKYICAMLLAENWRRLHVAILSWIVFCKMSLSSEIMCQGTIKEIHARGQEVKSNKRSRTLIQNNKARPGSKYSLQEVIRFAVLKKKTHERDWAVSLKRQPTI